jgi:hypothetical protein
MMTENQDQLGSSENHLMAFRISDQADYFPINNSSPRRQWMSDTPNQFANRCLPLLIANQAGWEIRSPITFDAIWDGSKVPHHSMSLILVDGPPGAMGSFSDHFGCGILTFNIPYLFQTPDGVCLSVRGSPNQFMENIMPLEGIVETSWNPATFTMNWRLIKPHVTTRIEAGAVLCFLQPISLALIENLRPALADITENDPLNRRFRAWLTSRLSFNSNPARTGRDWQGDYFRGSGFPGKHKRRMHLRPFTKNP